MGGSVNTGIRGVTDVLGFSPPRNGPTGAERMGMGMASEQYAAGAPIRQEYLDTALKLLRGEMDPTQLAGFDPMMNLGERNINAAFGTARDSIMENAPVGNQGAITRAMANMNMQRAEQRGTLASTIAEMLMGNYLGTAAGFANPAPAMGLAGDLGATAAGRANTALTNQTQRYGTTADLLNKMAASKFGKGG